MKPLLACAGCGKPLEPRHRCKPDLTAIPPKRLDAYWGQIFRTPGAWAVDELERIRDEYIRRRAHA